MADNFLMNNIGKLVNSDSKKRGDELKKKLAEQAKSIESKEKKKATKSKTAKKKTSKPVKKTQEEKISPESEQSIDSINDKVKHDEIKEYDFSQINNREYKAHLSEYIKKNLQLGYTNLEILEHLVEYGVDYDYANSLITNVNPKVDPQSFIPDETSPKKQISKIDHKSQRFGVEVICLVGIILLFTLLTGGNIILITFALFPTILNLCLIHYHFAKAKNYLMSVPTFLLIIAIFGVMFNYISFGALKLNQIIDVKVVVFFNIVLTLIYALLEFETIMQWIYEHKKHFHFDKERSEANSKSKKDIKFILSANIKELDNKIKELNHLIKKTYGLKKDDLKDVLIDTQHLNALKKIDYKNIILKAHTYFNIADLLEHEIRKLENNENTFEGLEKKTPHLKRDALGRYSIMSVIMVNNEDVDLKKLWDQIFFIIDTIKGELYNHSI